MTEITKKLVLKPVPATKFPTKSTVTLGLIYAIPLLLMMSSPDARVGAIVWGLAGGAALFFVMSLIHQRAMVKSSTRIMKAVAPRAKEAMVAFIGSEPRYIDVRGTITRDWNPPKAAGTGMAYDGQYLFIMDDGVVARIPWAAVRNWTWRIEGYSTNKLLDANRAATANARLQNNVGNANASAEAKRNSGFFVEVADIEQPQWQFRTDNEQLLRRWDEILTQIKEGKLATA